MSWSYSGDPSKSNRDWVRWRVQDTNASNKKQSDAEIDAALVTYGSKERAAVEVLRTIGRGYLDRVDTTMGKLKIAHSQRAKAYFADADKLERELAFSAVPWAGGISVADKESYEEDSDRVKPKFGKGMHDTVEGQDAQSEYQSTDRWS